MGGNNLRTAVGQRVASLVASAACDLASCQWVLSPADLAPIQWPVPHV